jgi:hypothetical protein
MTDMPAEWRAKAARLRGQAEHSGCSLCAEQLREWAAALEAKADEEER